MKYNPVIVRAYFREQGLPTPIEEFQFHFTRQWRFDFAWPVRRIALEVEGGVWIGGAHNRGKGFAKDMEKYNAAACDGWRVLRVQPKDLCTYATVEMIKQAYDAKTTSD